MADKRCFMRVNVPVLKTVRVFAGQLQGETGVSHTDAEALCEFIKRNDSALHERLLGFEAEEARVTVSMW